VTSSVLRVGDRGEPVRDLQTRLAALGLPSGGDPAGEFGAALSSVFPPGYPLLLAPGIALGFDRLVMLLMGAARIEDVQWTPPSELA
jgi:aspartyl-tRNA synthetase